jgi:FkbM family methyltransferase
MSFITDRRKARFCKTWFASLRSPLVFVDVGSGGPLKHPWTLLPVDKIEKVDFDPEPPSPTARLPLCVSNAAGERTFNISRDPRSSSLHEADPRFVERFSQPSLLTERRITVRCATLDEYFAGRFAALDFFDINVEGHDFQVLQGSERLFENAFIKVVKIEFELAQVWRGQGWFGDIDAWMRARGFEIANLEFDRIRPAVASRLFHPGEPVWGKALYVPGAAAWAQRALQADPENLGDDIVKAVGLYTILGSPGRALELLQYRAPNAQLADSGRVRSSIAGVFRYAFPDEVFSRAVGAVRALARQMR